MTQIFGHRGASAAEPENTLAAFARAVEMGADGVELDVRRTADHRLVIHHDPILPDGRVLVETRSADLPNTVPSLSEALDACEPIAVNIELKNHRADPDYDPSMWTANRVVAELARRGGGRRWLLSSFDQATINTVRTLAPDVRTAQLVVELTEDAIAASAEHDAVHPHHGHLTEGAVKAAHGVGLAVNVWTVNEADRIDELLRWGVDGIVTDRPDLALARRDR